MFEESNTNLYDLYSQLSFDSSYKRNDYIYIVLQVRKNKFSIFNDKMLLIYFNKIYKRTSKHCSKTLDYADGRVKVMKYHSCI